MALTITSGPSAEPASLTEAKAHLRVTGTDDDTYITSLIETARGEAEVYLGRAIINQTASLTLDGFPASGPIYLPWGKVSTLTSIAYVDTAGDNQTWSSALYQADLASVPARVQPVYGEAYPSTRPQLAAVTVTYTCGYGAAAANVPEPVRQAILLRIADMYAHRETVVIGQSVGYVARAMERLLDTERILEVA